MPRFLAITPHPFPLFAWYSFVTTSTGLEATWPTRKHIYASPGVPTLAMIASTFGTGTPNWVESLTLKAPRSARASTFTRLMKSSKSDDARASEKKKRDKNMTEKKEKTFFTSEPPYM